MCRLVLTVFTFPYHSGLHHWRWDNTITPVSVKQIPKDVSKYTRKNPQGILNAITTI